MSPEDAGLQRVSLSELKGGDGAHNAKALKALLSGAAGPYRDIVLLNTAAALIVAGRASSLAEGVGLAEEAISSGRAAAALEKLVAIKPRGRLTTPFIVASPAGCPPCYRASNPISLKIKSDMADILEKITKYKREEVAAAQAELPLQVLAEYARSAPRVRSFAGALEAKHRAGESA